MKTKQLVLAIPEELHKDFKRMSVEVEKSMVSMLIESIEEMINNYKENEKKKSTSNIVDSIKE